MLVHSALTHYPKVLACHTYYNIPEYYHGGGESTAPQFPAARDNVKTVPAEVETLEDFAER